MTTSLLHSLQDRLADPAIPWKTVVASSVLAGELFEAWVGSRQRRFLDPILAPTLPASLKPYITGDDAHETHSKSQAYARHKLTFGSVVSAISLVETAVLLTDVSRPILRSLGLSVSTAPDWTLLRIFWDAAKHVPGVGGGAGAGEIRQTMGFIALATLASTLLSIPADLYKNFVMEEKHGFNKMTRATWVKDLFKGLLVSLVLEVPLVAGIVKIIQWAGQDAVLRIVSWTIGFVLFVQLAMVLIYPSLIAPLFNKFTPLAEDSPVFPRIKALAQRLDFPLGHVWVVDGSTRSSHSNAYFYGVPGFPKHIVIYDTLLDKSKPEEVEAVLAHELGHWKGTHIVYLLATSLAQVAFSLSIFSLLLSNRHLLASFGFAPSLAAKLAHPVAPPVGPTVIALYLASTLFSPLSSLLKFVTNLVTRRLEYDADAFAAKLGGGYARNLKQALVTIHEKNLAVYGVDHVYSALNHNHPTLVERLEALDAQLDKAGEKKVE
ncbi:putative CAAX prenyl protease [Rhodotorula diobovata]|uniref:CAAX prenyl protease n=1 Tax=Rhodotorula diobovata TaxID=5288 RepID=A0A5C5FYJ0_9BASI|nr:putative CAAX prenyl protease [Rhodotorula diobovata]